MNDWLPATVAGIAALATIVAAIVTGRSALAAQRLQVEHAARAAELAAATAAAESKLTGEDNAGKLALSIALATRAEHRETRGRLDAHEEWREELVNEWLPDHEDRDRAVERELARLDPHFVPPPWKPLPRLKRYVPPSDGPAA